MSSSLSFLTEGSSSTSFDPPRVPQAVFTGVNWGAAVLSFIFLAIRLYSRLRHAPRRLYWDDGFIMFAWLLALLTSVLWQFVAPYMYIFMNVISGQLWPPPDTFLTNTEQYYTGHLIVLIFFYTCLFCIKLSFLFFFKRMGENVAKQKYIWWPVFAVTVAVYIIWIGTIQYKCLARPLEQIIANCSADSDVAFELTTLKSNCALDVVTDFLIMMIPINLVWQVKIQWKKKLALVGLFSLVIITMVFAIVRVVVVTDATSRQPDTSWLYLWSSIEQAVAIIVACLSAFPSLFVQSNQNSRVTKGHQYQYQYQTSYRSGRTPRDEGYLSNPASFTQSDVYLRVQDTELEQLAPPPVYGAEKREIRDV